MLMVRAVVAILNGLVCFSHACCYNSSVGMAKAALEVVNGVNLFGKHGAHWSVIFVDIDAHYRNRTTVDSILARESASKVVRRRGGGRGLRLASLGSVAYLFLYDCRSVTVVDMLAVSVTSRAAACHTVVWHLYHFAAT